VTVERSSVANVTGTSQSADGAQSCGECFALVRRLDIERHMEWHRYAAPVQRAGPVLDEKYLSGEEEGTPSWRR
jgi:hypothetical protein